MASCTNCTGTLMYTTYIRTLVRNETTHRSKQQYVPIGIVCLDCKALQYSMLSQQRIAAIRLRRLNQH